MNIIGCIAIAISVFVTKDVKPKIYLNLTCNPVCENVNITGFEWSNGKTTEDIEVFDTTVQYDVIIYYDSCNIQKTQIYHHK